MKKFTAALALLSLLLCGCNAQPITEIQIAQTVAGQDVIIDTPNTMYLGETIYAVGTCPVTDTALDDQGHEIFSQTYQKFRFYLDNNHVQQTIEADLQLRLDQFFANAGYIQNLAREECFSTDDWTPYWAHIQYTPARVDDTVISLYADHRSYNGTGTAHSLSAVCYDVNTGSVLCLGDILEPSCSGTVLAQDIIDRLGATEGLYDNYQDILKDTFSGDFSTMSNWYLNQAGLCFLFSPYDISPKNVSVLIPYNALEGILQERFLPVRPEAIGALGAGFYQPELDQERFSFIANLELDAQGQSLVIYPSDTISDFRVEIGTLSEDGTAYTPESTVFAAGAFYAGNALVITLDQSPDAPVLQVSYRSEGMEASAWVLCNQDDGTVLLAYG
ncbi:MAG: DUF3298 domain-containing protein [Oscillospiraceae bacterium]|nr:DUF3298 domain-containing protein [Oscillospiraceae bacterium]